jgi:hypothetical protein
MARLFAVAALTLALLVPSLSAGAVQQRTGRRAGEQRSQQFHCRMAATRLGGEITVTFWLNTRIAHRDWRIRFWDNGEQVFSAVRTTNLDGNLRVRETIPNLRGRDELRGKARDLIVGTVCDVQLTV